MVVSSKAPPMSRSNSTISIDYDPMLDDIIREEMENETPGFFDLLDSIGNFAPSFENINKKIGDRSRRLRHELASRAKGVEPLQGKVNKEFDRVKARFTRQLDRAASRWESPKAVKVREKVAFVFGVGNVFLTGFLLGGYPQFVHILYTIQVLTWLPWRYYTYHKRGMHYFIADLCYWVNLLTILYLWVFPGSEHLLAACFYLSFGSLAWAIIAWRNSLVFHSVDKITSLFIHIFPPAVMQSIIHIVPRAYAYERFPATERILKTPYKEALLSSALAYVLWQTLYYIFIQVRRQEKIKAGRPTSFTWLLKSYSKSWIGKQVLRLPEALQPFAFMAIQFAYAIVTMLPCPLWLHYRLAAVLFLASVFSWSIWNGANYYARISAARDQFKEEIALLRAEIANMEQISGSSPATPATQPRDQFISDFDLTQLEKLSKLEEQKSANTDANAAAGSPEGAQRRASGTKKVTLETAPTVMGDDAVEKHRKDK